MACRTFKVVYTERNDGMVCILQAYKVGLYGPKIVWVFPGWYSTKFWIINPHEVNCTTEEMILVVEGAFLTAPIFRNVLDELGVANITGLPIYLFSIRTM